VAHKQFGYFLGIIFEVDWNFAVEACPVAVRYGTAQPKTAKQNIQYAQRES